VDVSTGIKLEVTVQDGQVEIEPASRDVQIVQRGPLWVAVPLASGEPLAESTVERTRRKIRDQRP
jgi:hypothetical protein